MTVDRYRSLVDVFLLLQRNDGRVLLLRRAEGLYAGGQLCLVSGHLEDGETVLAGARREAAEEVGVAVDEADVEFCHVIHHRSPEGVTRLGVAFTAQRWGGEPYNAEPHKHTGLVWVDPAYPPAGCVPYTAALLRRFTEGGLYSAHGWPPSIGGTA